LAEVCNRAIQEHGGIEQARAIKVNRQPGIVRHITNSRHGA